jgi:flagellar protein FliS
MFSVGMNYNSPQQNYLEDQILSADPVQLIGILYRGALDAVANAGVRLASGEIAARSAAISKGVAILHELSMSVNREKGGRLGTDLVELYDYMQRRLLDANVSRTPEPLLEVERLLTVLLEGWRECEEKVSLYAEPSVKLFHDVESAQQPSLSVSY